MKTNIIGPNISIIPASKPTTLEKRIETKLHIEPTETEVKKFANGETYVNIKDDLRNKDVYLMPVIGRQVNDNLMETYLKADAARRMGAHKIVAVMPNFPYGRQERKTEKGEPISARLNMALLHASGVDEVITTDLHTQALQGFVREMKLTDLTSYEEMAQYFETKGLNKNNLVVVSPDIGGTKRADKLSSRLGCDKAIVYKHRSEHNKATAEDLIGEVKNKTCIIYDDLIDTAGTVCEAARLLKEKGAGDIYICAAHGLFNGTAMDKLSKAPIKEVVVTNSERKPNSKIKQVDISDSIVGTILDISI